MKKLRFFNRKTVMVSVLVMMLMMVTSAVYALTITVDGNEADWVAPAGQIADIGGNEGSIPDAADIEYVRWTNNQTDMFFLVNTYGTPARVNGASWVLICLDTDNNTSTGSTAGFLYYTNCNSLIGFDRIVLLQSNFGTYSVGIGSVSNTDVITYPGVGAYGYTTNDVVELSAPLSLLGFGPGTCPGTIPSVVYFDGGDGSDDDNTPDGGSTNIGCGLPTAVSLQNVSANSTSTLPVVGFIAFALMAIVGTGVALTRRQRA